MSNSYSNDIEIIHFTSLGYGELRLAKKYCEKEILDNLFQTDGGLIIVDAQGEEVFPVKDQLDSNKSYYPTLIPNTTYTIVSEKDLDSDTEDDEDEDDTHDDQDDDIDDADLDDTVEIDDENTIVQPQQQQQPQPHQHSHEENCCKTGDQHQHEHKHEGTSNCCSNHQTSKSEQKKIQIYQMGYDKLLKMREARINMISKLYQRKYPEIFELKEEYFDESFINPIKQYKKTQDKEDLLKALTKLTDTRIYSFRIFKLDFCTKLLEEIENFKNSGLPTARPNSMNNYGAVLDEIGFTELFNQLRDKYLSLFTSILYKDYNGDCLNGHHAFAVQYKMDKEKELGFHYDESDITVNLCLGREFTGGSLYFKGILEKPETHNEYFEINHTPGVGLIHVGHHRHGALGLTSGERTNLILWLRNISNDNDNSNLNTATAAMASTTLN